VNIKKKEKKKTCTKKKIKVEFVESKKI